MLPSLFQEVTCSDIVFFQRIIAVIPFSKGIEFICDSCCSHPFDEWPFSYKIRAIAASHSFKFTVFFKTWRYHKYYLWYLLSFRHVYIERSLLCDDINSNHTFFYDSIIFSWEYLTRFICQGQRACFTTLVVAIQFNQQSVFDSRKLEEYVYLRKAVPALHF